MSTEIPLFPLNVVLFPGMQLPLHIFEPRYRLMIKRCLEGDQQFGVALIEEGEEGQPGTVPAPAGCSCEIVESTAFPDGRMNIVTVGRRRFHILAVREEDDYLIGTVEWLDDAPTGTTAEQLADRVRGLLVGYLKTITNNTDISNIAIDELDVPNDPYNLSMWVAALLVISNEQKQHLLLLDCTEDRLEAEYALLARSAIIQRAFERREIQMAAQKSDEEPNGPFEAFASLN